MADGKALRAQLPRSSLADYRARVSGDAALAILNEQSATRLERLVPAGRLPSRGSHVEHHLRCASLAAAQGAKPELVEALKERLAARRAPEASSA